LEKLSTPLLKTFGNKFPDPGFLKSMGTPIKVNESFDGKNQPDTDSEHMKELKSGKCNYSTIFASGSTTVLLDILYNEQFGPCIGITYMRNKFSYLAK